MKEKKYDLPCNIAQTLNIIGDKWTLLVVHEIFAGNSTFNQIKNSLDGISSNLLSDRLKLLERNGLITTKLYSEHPPRYEYTLTNSGKDLEGVFNALILWGKENLEECYKKIIHTPCQHEIEMVYYCPHCKENVEDIDIVELENKVPSVN